MMIPAGSHHCGLLRIQKDKTLTQEAASRSWGHQNQSAHKNMQRGPDRTQLLAHGGMGHQQHTSQDAWPCGAGAGVGPSPGSASGRDPPHSLATVELWAHPRKPVTLQTALLKTTRKPFTFYCCAPDAPCSSFSFTTQLQVRSFMAIFFRKDKQWQCF